MKFLFRLSVLLTVLFITTQVSAQPRYKPGSIITSNGQTIRGLIDYRQWEKNPRSIKFRESETGSPVVYTVNELASFEVDGFDRYETAIVTKDMRPVEISELEGYSSETVFTDTVFLRLLVKGGLSLYQFEDSKQHFYIKEQGREFQELLYKVYLIDSKLSEMPIFRDQLRAMLSSAANPGTLIPLINAANYKEKDLVKIVDKMNVILYSETVTYKVARQKQHVSFFVGAGMAYSTLKYSGPSDNLSNLKYSNSTSPLVMAGIDFGMGRNFQKLVLRFDLSWYKLKYEGKNNPSSQDSVRYHLEMSNLAPSFSILYNVLNSPNQKLYLGAGAAYNFSNYPKNILHKKYGDFSNITTRSPHLELQKNWIAINAKAGFILNKKFEFATTVTFDGSFANFTGFSLNPFIVFTNLNYRF